jgi:hypothetical protein
MAVIISVSKNDLNYNYGLQKNNNLVGDYLIYRENFKIIQRQFSQLIIFKNHYTASLLSIGGFLVLSQ